MASMRVARSVQIGAFGRKTVALFRASRVDRRRINRDLRRRRSLSAVVKATAGPGIYAPDRRVTLTWRRR